MILTDPSILVRHANQRLVMIRDRKEVAAVPVADVSHVALHGPVTMTGAAVARLLDAGIDVSLHSSSGRWRGMITGARAGNVYLVLAQAAAWRDDGRRAQFARALVASKIEGERELVQRKGIDRGSERCREAAARLAELERRVAGEQEVEGIRGLEGAAAAVYFGVFGEMLSAPWAFERRVRRPATDPVNALLGYGYAIASGELARQLAWGGFDTRIGLLHGTRYGRESLVLDLLEEFRAPLVDRFTLRVLNNGQLEPEDFEEGEDRAVRLTSEGRRKYLELWERMMGERAPQSRMYDDGEAEMGAKVVTREKEAGWAGVSWRFRMERQVNRLRRFLMEGASYCSLHRGRTKRRREAGAGGGGEAEAERGRSGGKD